MEVMLEFLEQLLFFADPNPDSQDPYGMFLGLLDPDPVVRGMDPNPSIIKQKNKKTLNS
jgi:hypothetical protein